MAERTVKVNLTADVSDYTASLARAAAQTRGLSDSVDREFKRTETRSRASGERAGGLFARGFAQNLTRNSTLITVAATGALAAGAPAVIAGAGALFAGVGAVAAAQSIEVRRAWISLGQEIRDGAVEDAQALVPVIANVADRIGSAFEGLRPQLREAFAAVAPQIDTVVGSLITASNVAVPALVRAVEAGSPVIDGLAHVVESIGDGLADFLDNVSAHAPAAGVAFAAIGDIVGELLPILGDLAGTGTELAAVVLPPLAAVLGVLADVLHAIEPVLPLVAAGFAAFRVAGALDGPIKSLAQNLAFASYNGGAFATAAGKASTAASGLASGLPLLGTVVALFSASLQRSNEQADEWAHALAAGGDAADEARAQMSNFGTAAETVNTGFGGFVANLSGVTGQIGNTAHALQGARDRADELKDSMTPLQRAQENASAAQERYNAAVEKYGENSPQAVAAAHAYRVAQGEVEAQSERTRVAIDGTTQAMVDQADQALAGLDSGFAYRHSLDQLEDAQGALNQATQDYGPHSEQAQRAQLDLEEQTYRTALAYGQQQADLSGLSSDSIEYKRIVQEQMLGALYRLRDTAGPEMRAAIDKQIRALQDAGVQMDTTAGRAENLEGHVRDIPQYTRIKVEADLGGAEKSLSDFVGRHWTAIISSQVEGSGTSGRGGTTRRLAAGGPVVGPGGPTSDEVPIMGSNGEHMWTAREVDAVGGHRSMFRLRQFARAGALRLANGGPVLRDKVVIHYGADLSGAETGILAARKAAGQLLAAIPGPGGSVERWAPLVAQVLGLLGQSSSLVGAVLQLIKFESGGNPYAINLTDINAQRGDPSRGLVQTIGATFNAYAGPYRSRGIYDPLANVYAGLNYGIHRYGSVSAIPGIRSLASGGRYRPYADGGVIGEPVAGVGLRTGDRYMLGERGPEQVTPLRSREVSGGGSSSGGAPSVVRETNHYWNISGGGENTRRLAKTIADEQRIREALYA